MKQPIASLLAGLAFAGATSGAGGQTLQPYQPGLVEYMTMVQSHHAKLWLAGNARNWDLADYQADELKELLEEIAKRVPDYKGVPVGKMFEAVTMRPIGDVESAIKNRDSEKFVAAFDRLTAACNSCHEAANRSFIVIQRPSASAFPNQSFAPRKK